MCKSFAERVGGNREPKALHAAWSVVRRAKLAPRGRVGKKSASRSTPRASGCCRAGSWTFSIARATAFEIVGYENIQFTKAPHVLKGMGLTALSKSAQAIKELTEKSMAPA